MIIIPKKARLWTFAIAILANECAADGPGDRVVNALLRGHNRERRLKELEPLKLSSKLCEAAQIHARDMAGHEKISHTGSDGSAPADRIKRVGYTGVRTGENCAEGQWTVGEVMSGWMRSPGHRAIVLANFTEMGAAYARDDHGTLYWCVDFGTPRRNSSKAPRKPDDIAAAVVKQINRDREADRMVLLQPEPTLTKAAMALCAAMAAKDSLETDAGALNLINKKVLHGREVVVRLGTRLTSAEKAARELHGIDADSMQSFREIGVGYALARSGTPYWCAIFAKPAELEPAADLDRQRLP